MLKRLNIYFKEMFPILPRLGLGFLLFFEIYFLVILISDVKDIQVGLQEIIGSITIFSFLLSLRIADDFKDYETDLRLFPSRALPAGKVKKSDLKIFIAIVIVIIVLLNLIFMNNQLYFIGLVAYGILMSVWFFNKVKIQKSLPLALITHNPVQIVLNTYVISFACIKYKLPIFTINNILILFTLYWPGLIWEISRKVRAPKDETEYVTYSKLFGFKKATKFILIVMFFDMITSSLLIYNLYHWAVILVIISYLWLVKQCIQFMNDPTKFKLVKKVEMYEYLTEIPVVIIELIYIASRWLF